MRPEPISRLICLGPQSRKFSVLSSPASALLFQRFLGSNWRESLCLCLSCFFLASYKGSEEPNINNNDWRRRLLATCQLHIKQSGRHFLCLFVYYSKKCTQEMVWLIVLENLVLVSFQQTILLRFCMCGWSLEEPWESCKMCFFLPFLSCMAKLTLKKSPWRVVVKFLPGEGLKALPR